MFKIIEVTKGVKIEENGLRFGSTPEHDYWLIPINGYYSRDVKFKQFEEFSKQLKELTSKSCFEYSSPMRDFFFKTGSMIKV